MVNFVPRKARILLELTYELPVEDGYIKQDGGRTHDPDEMLDVDMEQIMNVGFSEFIDVVGPELKTISFEVVD